MNSSSKDYVALIGSGSFIAQNFKRKLTELNYDFCEISGHAISGQSLDEFFSKNTPHTLIYFVGYSGENLRKLNTINTSILNIVMLSAVKYGIKRFIYISSGAVYGNLSNRQSKETDNLTPISNYGLSKVISETIVLFYARKYNIIPVIIRIPHVYGNGKNSGIIHNFYTSINKYGYISLDGDGQQGRNFLHIDDLCDSLYAILISKISGIYNITNSAKVTVNKVVEYFSKCIPFKIKSSKRGVITNMNLYLDGTKLTKLLGVVNKRSIWDYIRGLYGA